MVDRSLIVYVTEPIHRDAHALLSDGAFVNTGNIEMSHNQIRDQVSDADVLLSKTDPIAIDAELIDAAPRLRLIARHGSGYSNVDVDHATNRGIMVSNTPGVNAVTIAEYTIGMMFAAARRFNEASAACHFGNPSRTALTGVELKGKIFGIAGVGQIGKEVVRRAHALGMKVLAYHPRPSASTLSSMPLELVDLDTLLQKSDVVSLHVPLTDSTRGLIGRREFKLMKPEAILLNLARGGVVDERALYEVLKQKQIFGVATDVLVNEPVRAEEPLLTLKNCMVLPHIAAMTDEAQRAVALSAVSEILRFSRGEKPQHIINPEVLDHVRPGNPL